MADNPFEREAPHSKDAEIMILGTIILDRSNRMIGQAQRLLQASDFFIPSHRFVYLAMLSLIEQGKEISPVLLSEELKSRKLGWCADLSYLTNLTFGLPGIDNLEPYTRVLREKTDLRRLMILGKELYNEAAGAEEKPERLAEVATKQIQKLLRAVAAQTDGGGSYAEIEPEFRTYLTHVKQGNIVACPTGLITVDLHIHGGGPLPGNLVGVAGLSGGGKSSLALQMCEHNAASGRRSVYFSYEMSAVENYTRSIGPRAEVQVSHIGPGIDSFRLGFVERAIPEVSALPIHVYTNPKFRSIDKAWEKVRQLKEEGKQVDIVVFDNMKQLNGKGAGRFDTKTEELAYICGRAKAGAQEENCVAMILAHFNSSGYKDTFPSWDNINGGQSLRDECDLAMTIWTARNEYGKEIKTAKLKIAKQRMGDPDQEFDLQFDTRTMRFTMKEG